MTAIGDTITIDVSKNGVKFSVSGDVGDGSVTLRNTASDKVSCCCCCCCCSCVVAVVIIVLLL